MRKFFVLLALGCFVALNFSACKPKSESETPQKAVEAFLNYLSKDDFESAMGLATPETVELLKQFQQNNFNLYKGSVIEVTGCEMISETQAECNFTSDGDSALIHANPIEGKWMVHMHK